MNALAVRRRHPAAIFILLLLGLIVTGAGYAALAPKQATAATASADQIERGRRLFLTNCATCHGKDGLGSPVGPNLAGVGAAAVDFQMGTGRMPMAEPGVQAPRGKKVTYSAEEIADIAAWVASLAPGPAVPDAEYTTAEGGNAGRGGEIFRVNCAMCHNSAGAGGALTRGKYAPKLTDVEGRHIYEAMLTGPQSMPVFNDNNISPESKRDVIAYLKTMDEAGSPGGMALGSLGPVPEGLVAWVFGLGILIGAACWLGQKGA
ncbi:MAG: c-type cytochrome [Actinobacteria bacterium]|nr:c-type cytochrome [Actinomycetota bacterium]